MEPGCAHDPVATLTYKRLLSEYLDCELNLEKSHEDMRAGRTIPMEQTFINIRKEFDE